VAAHTATTSGPFDVDLFIGRFFFFFFFFVVIFFSSSTSRTFRAVHLKAFQATQERALNFASRSWCSAQVVSWVIF
jgi:hypothetical protein